MSVVFSDCNDEFFSDMFFVNSRCSCSRLAQPSISACRSRLLCSSSSLRSITLLFLSFTLLTRQVHFVFKVLTLVQPWKFSALDGLFTLTDTNSGTDSDSTSKPSGYIVLCRTGSHYRDSDSNPYSDSDPQSLQYSFLGWIAVPGLGCGTVSGNVNKP